jgi:hypothetical protein
MKKRIPLLVALALAVVTAAVSVAVAQADAGPPWGPETPHFNLEAILRPAMGGPASGFGHVKFRQPNDGTKIVYLDTWVRDLGSSHSYSLQRATDTNVDGNCTGANWLTLGQITTDEKGTGRAALSRDLAAIPLGTSFDIHFRIVDTVTSAVVLESGCYQFVVSQ